MDSVDYGDDFLQPAWSSNNGKSSKSPSVSSHLGQLFSSLTSAATASISNLSPSHKLTKLSKHPPLPTPPTAPCAIPDIAAPVVKKMQQLPASILPKARPPPIML